MNSMKVLLVLASIVAITLCQFVIRAQVQNLPRHG